jgi:multicomponent Na+:H+ antiporter subunit D
MHPLISLPLVIPLLTAIASLLTWRWQPGQSVLGVIGTAGLLGAALGLFTSVWQEGITVAHIGGWPAPFGITLVADLLSAIMVVLAGLIGFAVAVYSLANIDTQRRSFGYYPLLHILLLGICGAFLAGDLFNLYVWFEVLLIASFVLLVLGGERAQLEGGVKYVALNLIASILLLTGVGLLHGLTGTLNMADLARKLSGLGQPGLVTAVAMLFLVAFGIKAAVFPLFFWLPASYHTPPAAVSAIFAGLLTKVGVYALIRVFTLLFVQDVTLTHTLILVIAGLTVVTGVLGAVAVDEFRRILSFHIISQIGYMIMGLGLFTPFGLAASVFYIAHHMIVKTNLFLMSGVTHRLYGTYDVKELGGLYQEAPFVAILFLLPAVSLAGMPPLSGFFAKLALAQAGLEVEQYAIVATGLAVSLLTLFSMTKVWAEAFWKPLPGDPPRLTRPASAGLSLMLLSMAGLATVTVLLGLAAEPAFAVATRAARQLMNPEGYIQAVLGAEG